MFLERPIRAYSVGSRLEHNKRKMRVDMLSAEHGSNTSRVRAFSVGSRAKVARSDLYKANLTNSTNLMKANSQDIANLNTTINNNRMAVSNSSQKNQNALNNNITSGGGSSSDMNKKSMSIPFLANGTRSTVKSQILI